MNREEREEYVIQIVIPLTIRSWSNVFPSSRLCIILYSIIIAGYLFMDILKFGHHATNQTNTTETPAGVIKISDKEARERSTIPYIDPNPVPFTTLRLSTPACV
jgi:hypothetical protein